MEVCVYFSGYKNRKIPRTPKIPNKKMYVSENVTLLSDNTKNQFLLRR